MINFLHNNETVRVRFTYRYGKTTGPFALRKIGKRRIVTEAEISAKDVDGNWRTLSVGQARRSPLDRFEKKTGRFIALLNALKQINDRQLRAAIGQEYQSVHPFSSNMDVRDKVAVEN